MRRRDIPEKEYKMQSRLNLALENSKALTVRLENLAVRANDLQHAEDKEAWWEQVRKIRDLAKECRSISEWVTTNMQDAGILSTKELSDRVIMWDASKQDRFYRDANQLQEPGTSVEDRLKTLEDRVDFITTGTSNPAARFTSMKVPKASGSTKDDMKFRGVQRDLIETEEGSYDINRLRAQGKIRPDDLDFTKGKAPGEVIKQIAGG